MSQHSYPERRDDRPRGHPTTRRGFITGVGFGVVSLYGLWAAYGATPISLSFISEGMEGMGHGVGHAGGGGMSPEEFRRKTQEFIEANSLPDGSVKPMRHAAARIASEAHDDHGASPQMSMAGDHEDEEAGEDHAREEAGHAVTEEPIDVYVVATRYGYEPDVLRLDLKTPYKFRFMAVDADHGASINMRLASHMIRCRAKTLTEKTLVFTSPGEYLLYCTVYCGEGHDTMMGKIVVA